MKTSEHFFVEISSLEKISKIDKTQYSVNQNTSLPIKAVEPNINEKYIANMVNTKNMTIDVVSGMPKALPNGIRLRYLDSGSWLCIDL